MCAIICPDAVIEVYRDAVDNDTTAKKPDKVKTPKLINEKV